MKRKLLSILALLCLTVTSAWADIVASGNCGTSGHETEVTWTLTSDGVMTISGTGAMANYDSETKQPWASNRTSITSIVVETGVTSIGNIAFKMCTSLATVTIGSSVTSIVNHAFNACNSLTSINIPYGVTSISNNLFYKCTSLTSLTIPASVTSISYSAFMSSGLKSVTFYGTPTCYIASSAFESAPLENIYVFSNLEGDFEKASYWNNYATKISAISVTANEGSSGEYWATYYNDHANVKMPDETQVFKVALEGTGITLTEITDHIVNAGQGVVLKSTSGSSFTLASAASGSETSYSGNSLTCPASSRYTPVPLAAAMRGGSCASCTPVRPVSYPARRQRA